MSRIKVDAIENTSGVQKYLTHTWILFNGEGTVSIRSSANVSSLTDNAVGDFTITFSNATPTFDYVPHYNYGDDTGSKTGGTTSYEAPLTTSQRCYCGLINGSGVDRPYNSYSNTF